MYQTSSNYKEKVYEPSTKHLLRVFINQTEIDKRYILDYKPSYNLFGKEEFCLGVTPAHAIDLKLYKTAVPNNIKSIYITTGIDGEEIPIGYFNVDDISKDNDYTVTLKLIDDMIKFEFPYDGSNLIKQKGYAEIIEVLNDLCTKAGVELRFYFLFKYA